MKEELDVILWAIVIFVFLWLFASWFARANVYDDATKQKMLEYCRAQGKDYSQCWNAIYKYDKMN